MTRVNPMASRAEDWLRLRLPFDACHTCPQEQDVFVLNVSG